MSQDRAQTATAVFAGAQFLLFDCGDGAERAMEAQGLPMSNLNAVFITHFHSDHFADLGEVIDRSFIMGRRHQLTVYGPEGTHQLVSGFTAAYAKEYAHRTEHHGPESMPPQYAGAQSVEFGSEELVVVITTST